jgi:hypothetical protein
MMKPATAAAHMPRHVPSTTCTTCTTCLQVAFTSPEDALAWCMATQRRLLACPWPQALLEQAVADCGLVLAPSGPPLKPRDLLPTYKRLQVSCCSGLGTAAGWEALAACSCACHQS